jgi:hypothetical protein
MNHATIPADRLQAVHSALVQAFGRVPDEPPQPVPGGASGALAYRVQVDGRDYLLRVESRRAEAPRNPHHYACLQAASDAGIAPRVRYADASAGVAIMDFVAQRPLADHPGGPAALVAGVGELLARLQHGPAFPSLLTYPDLIGRLLGSMTTSGRLAAGLLDRHGEAFGLIRDAYPWADDSRVASHNDPNPRNILFDGERLWLIDWETAFLNDPMVDVAIVTLELASTPELEGVLLRSWLGHEPDEDVRARLALMKPLVRLYYGLMLLTLSPASATPDVDLSAPSVEAFGADVASGRITIGSPEMPRVLGKMMLAGFLAEAGTSTTAEAVARFA